MKLQNFSFKLSSFKCMLAICLIISIASPLFAALPDTGQTKCYNDTGAEITCPSPGQDFYGQDGNYTINPTSYTKLDANGNVLADSAASWAMVKDNVTGLIWENKTVDGSVHDSGKTYNWADAQNVFIAQLNASNFGGHNDWRLPAREELRSIVDYGKYTPAINTGYFPNTQSAVYWSSSTSVVNTSHMWYVDFGYGYGHHDLKSNSYYVRAVRGGQSGSSGNLVINNDGTVTDTATGLMWQQAIGNNGVAMTWKAALAYCENLSLAGYTDWRLPNIRELASIADLSRYNPAINTGYFPDTQWLPYWSSSTDAYSTSYAWYVYFDEGAGYNDTKSSIYYVRAVRGGQSGSSGNLVISGSVKTASGAAISGVIMTLSSGATATTDSSGNYSFSNIVSGSSGTVTPSKSGYTFDPTSLSFSNISANQTLNFIGAVPVTQYTAVFQAGTGGYISSGSTSQTVSSGSSTNPVTATANSGYTFINWKDDIGNIVSTSATLSAQTITANKTYTANFTQVVTYTVSFAAGTGGTISPSGSQTVSSGSSTSPVTATANSGYTFINWTNQSGSVVSTSAMLPAQIITSDMTFTANFQQATTRIINLNGSLTFGNVNVGSTKQLTFTIGNSGNSPLTVSSISYPAGFTGNWSGGTIAAGGSQIVTVTFAPTAVQNYGNTVTVNSDKTSGTNTIAISGTGVAVTKIIGLSGSLAFGNVQPNTTKQLTFTIQNSGNSTMTVSSISYPTGFLGNWNSGTIAAGGSQIVTVTFAPTAAQTYSGTVTVNSDKTGGTNTLAISGTGLVSNYSISGYVRDSANNLGMSGVTVNFGSIGTLTTDSSGYYSKSVSSGWSGTVTVSKSGYSFTPPSRTYSNISSDQSSQNYMGTVITYTVSGYVRKSSDNSGISGITLNFSNYGGTAVTDTSGYYSKAVSYNWSGTVTPTMAGYTFSPANLSYSNLTLNQSNQNYTATPTVQPNISVSPKSLIITPPKSSRSVRENTAADSQVYQLPAWNSGAVSETGYATGLMIPEEVKEYWKTNTPSLKYSRDNFPASKDWSMYDSPVKQQGSCGSCWTFSTTALIENLANQAGLPVTKDFAEQVLVSCTVPGSCGCSGGWHGNSLNYVRTNGLPPESCYPYKESDPCKIPSAKCEAQCSNPAFLVKIKNSSSGSLWGTAFTIDNLKGVLQDGPVLVAMWVPPNFGGYTGGVYHYTGGTTQWTNYVYTGHSVLLVGYNDADRSFKVKNSWGTYWGEGGYFRISYDDISTAVRFGSYAVAGSGAYIESQTTTTSFTIANTGSGNLTISSMSADKSWLDFSPQTSATLLPGEQRTISVSVKDWSAVPIPGDIAKITVSSNDPDEPSVIVQVNVSKPLMASPPFLTVSPPFQKDAFSVSEGKISIDVFSQSGTTEVGVSNSGEGTLNWTAISNSSWLNVIQGSTGSDSGTVSISYDANSGEPRTGTVTISADGATNSPFTVEIRQGKSGGIMGDIDNNNNVDLADAILALRVLAGITDLNVVIADVNSDNKIGLEEVIYILQKVAGLR